MGSKVNCPDCGHANLAGEETCASCHAPVSFLATPQPKHGMQRLILEGTVRDLQPHDAASLPESSTLAEAMRLMRQTKVGCVMVIRDEKLSGIVTERDLVLKSNPNVEPSRVPVKDVMHRDPECLQDTAPLGYAFHRIAISNLQHVPVRRSDGSLGVVSSRDLLRYLCR